ncbi:hypothetical protein DVH24_020678 [Malus domestica]|uniref:Uncharacterized protein n=1 Tax=Malus domestica TaxID=3750 RepID=A0A498J9Z4_MALDO|nr:hypothetical protein DVH24_020678 [Malus domestica]
MYDERTQFTDLRNPYKDDPVKIRIQQPLLIIECKKQQNSCCAVASLSDKGERVRYERVKNSEIALLYCLLIEFLVKNLGLDCNQTYKILRVSNSLVIATMFFCGVNDGFRASVHSFFFNFASN